MIGYRVELYCDGKRKVAGRKAPMSCLMQFDRGILHDDLGAMPNLRRNLMEIAGKAGWLIADGARAYCPECRKSTEGR